MIFLMLCLRTKRLHFFAAVLYKYAVQGKNLNYFTNNTKLFLTLNNVVDDIDMVFGVQLQHFYSSF